MQVKYESTGMRMQGTVDSLPKNFVVSNFSKFVRHLRNMLELCSAFVFMDQELFDVGFLSCVCS